VKSSFRFLSSQNHLRSHHSLAESPEQGVFRTAWSSRRQCWNSRSERTDIRKVGFSKVQQGATGCATKCFKQQQKCKEFAILASVGVSWRQLVSVTLCQLLCQLLTVNWVRFFHERAKNRSEPYLSEYRSPLREIFGWPTSTLTTKVSLSEVVNTTQHKSTQHKSTQHKSTQHKSTQHKSTTSLFEVSPGVPPSFGDLVYLSNKG
jgi:hypothetical protein